MLDAQGLALTMQYDGLLRLVSLTDATGKMMPFEYVGTDRKIHVIRDHFGRTASFGYDGMGRLTSITDALGIVSFFTYDDAANRPDRIGTLTTPYGVTTRMPP